MPNLTLTNPDPITPNVCSHYWISNLTLTPAMLAATLRPFDGQHVLGNASLAKRVVADPTKDTAAAAVITTVTTAVQAIAGKTAAISLITVSDADPLGKTLVLALFADKSIFRVADLFTLLASNSQAAAAFNALITFLATK